MTTHPDLIASAIDLLRTRKSRQDKSGRLSDDNRKKIQTPESQEAPKKRRNREHTNSKHGCSQCKSRKVKCDESKPKCKNCTRRGTPCIYPYDAPSNSNGSGGTRLRIDPPGLDELARLAASSPAYGGSHSYSAHGVGPYYNPLARPDYHAQGGYPPGRLSPSATFNHLSSAADPLDLNITHLELLHHFTYSTAPAITASPETEKLWANAIPKIAFSNRFLMHSIIAVSALHYAHIHPDQRGDYYTLASAHEERAVNLSQAIIAQPNVGNADSIYAFVLMRIYYAFAAPETSMLEPGPASDRARPLHGAVQTINTLRGLRDVFPLVREWVGQGSLAPLLDMQSGPSGPSEKLVNPESKDHWARLLLFASSSTSDRPKQVEESEVNAAAASSLRAFFLNLDSMVEGESSNSPVMQWAVRLPAQFIDWLADLDVVPLILVAHWCALLPQNSQYWWIQGWVNRTMNEIVNVLPQDLHSWLAWPETVIRGMRTGETNTSYQEEMAGTG